MGAADVIPGVSGGTMALIVGIYERLIEAIRLALGTPVRLVTAGWDAVREDLRQVEWGLIVPLGVGILTAIAAASGVIPHLLETYPERMRGLFFGLIAASIWIPWRELKSPGGREAATALLAGLVAFWLVGLPALAPAESPTLVRVFASAAVAICAMILPGVSGSFLLLVMGLYEVTLRAVRELDLVYVVTFMGGALVGLGLFSRFLTWLLARHPNLTMAALIGLMAGSLRALWPWQAGSEETVRVLLPPGENAALVLGFALAGAAAVILLTWAGARFGAGNAYQPTDGAV